MPRPSGWYRADGKPNLPKLDREATKKWWISLLEQAKQHDQPDRMAVKIERWLARNDLFYLLTIVCKRQDIDRDWLFERCREVQLEPNGYLDLWAREHGKMQALSEPTPTPDGWKLHGDLVPGDAIFGPDGKVCHVLALNEIVHGAECYEIEFDDGFKIKTGAEHLWSIERRTKKRIPMAWNTDGPKRQYRETVIMRTREIAEHDHRPDNRLAISVNDPLYMPEADLPIDPYVLGVWLGDGTRNSPNITSGRDDADEIEALIASCGQAVRRSSHSNAVTLCLGSGIRGKKGSSDFRNALRGLGIIGDKAIPEVYLRASIAQRLALLQGLMDTDGHCNPRGTATFANTNSNLVDGFEELCHTLGLKPNRRLHGQVVNGLPYPSWAVSFQAYRDLPPFRLGRKLERCKEGSRPKPRRYIVACRPVPSEPMRCIQVDREDGLYLTGTNMVTTHNSSIITFALSIQDILASHGENPEARYKGREVTIGIFSYTQKLAMDFLDQIKQEFEKNDWLKEFFPDVLYEKPERQSPSWSKINGITVKRKSNPRECTVEAWGLVDNMPTGKHFFIRVYDDVVVKESISETQLPKTNEAWELSLNLGARGGWIRYAGTKYAKFDTYHAILERGAAIPRIHPCVTETREINGIKEPVAETAVLMTPDEIRQKRREMGPYTFGAQCLLDPAADRLQGFRDDWIQFWEAENTKNLSFVVVCDPANAKKRDSDFTVFWVVGLGADENWYVVDVVRDKMNLPERCRMAVELHKRWAPKKFGWEEYGLTCDTQALAEYQKVINYRFHVISLGGQMAKDDRIRKLIPIFESGKIYLPRSIIRRDYENRAVDVIRQFVDDEYKQFPTCATRDMLDSLARITDDAMKIAAPALSVGVDTGSTYAKMIGQHENPFTRGWMTM